MVSPVTTVVVGVAGQKSYKWHNTPIPLNNGEAWVKVDGVVATWTYVGDVITISAPAITAGARIELGSNANSPGLIQTAVPVRKTYS